MKQSYDIEQSITSSPVTTYRDLDPTSAQNEHLDDFDILKGAQEVTKELKELQIRFDTNPKYLQKSDFDLLISILGKTIPWLYTQAQYTEIINSWSEIDKDEVQLASAYLINQTLNKLGKFKEIYVNKIYSNKDEVNDKYNMEINSQGQPVWAGLINTNFTLSGTTPVQSANSEYGVLVDSGDSIQWTQDKDIDWEYIIEVRDTGFHPAQYTIRVDGTPVQASEGQAIVTLGQGTHTITSDNFEFILTKISSNATNLEIEVMDPLILPRDPELNMEAATKQYVDNTIYNYSPEAGRNIQIENQDNGRDVIHARGYRYDEEEDSFIIGENTGSLIGQKHALASGLETEANGEASHSEGKYTNASGEGSHAEGNNTKTIGEFAHSEGDTTIAAGVASHAEGEGNYITLCRADGNYNNETRIWVRRHSCTDVGSNGVVDCSMVSDSAGIFISESDSDFSGSDYTSDGDPTTYKSYTGAATAKKSIWIGRALYNSAGDLLGYITDVSPNSFTLDRGVTLYDDNPIYILAGAYGQASHSEGKSNDALGNYSHAEGDNTASRGKASHAEGAKTIADGISAHAEGHRTEAIAHYSHTEGFRTHAEGEYGHAEGEDTKASGRISHAEGYQTDAENEASHAEGSNTHVEGMAAHAEGVKTRAKGHFSHTEGITTKSNHASHAEGVESFADGFGSHAEGYKTIAGRINEENDIIESLTLDGLVEKNVEIEDLLSVQSFAHAEGIETAAYTRASHTEGIKTLADASTLEDTRTSYIGYKQEGYQDDYDEDRTNSRDLSIEGYYLTPTLFRAIHGMDNLDHNNGLPPEYTIVGSDLIMSSNALDNRYLIDGESADVIYLSAIGSVNTINASASGNTITIQVSGKNSGTRNACIYVSGFLTGDLICTHNLTQNYSTGLAKSTLFGSTVGTTLKAGQCGVQYDLICNNSGYINSTICTLTLKLNRAVSVVWLGSYTCSDYQADYQEDPGGTIYYRLLKGRYKAPKYLTGSAAHAEGIKAEAKATAAHAEGYRTKALGEGSHSEGFKTEARAPYSHSSGRETKAEGDFSMALGVKTATTQSKWVQAELPYIIEEYNGNKEAGVYTTNWKQNSFGVYYSTNHDNNSSAEAVLVFPAGREFKLCLWCVGEEDSDYIEYTEINSTSYSKSVYGTQVEELHILPSDRTQKIRVRYKKDASVTESLDCGFFNIFELTSYGQLAAGISSSSEGYGTTATGVKTSARGAGAFATGVGTHAVGDGSIAAGVCTAAEGVGSMALGWSNSEYSDIHSDEDSHGSLVFGYASKESVSISSINSPGSLNFGVQKSYNPLLVWDSEGALNHGQETKTLISPNSYAGGFGVYIEGDWVGNNIHIVQDADEIPSDIASTDVYIVQPPTWTRTTLPYKNEYNNDEAGLVFVSDVLDYGGLWTDSLQVYGDAYVIIENVSALEEGEEVLEGASKGTIYVNGQAYTNGRVSLEADQKALRISLQSYTNADPYYEDLFYKHQLRVTIRPSKGTPIGCNHAEGYRTRIYGSMSHAEGANTHGYSDGYINDYNKDFQLSVPGILRRECEADIRFHILVPKQYAFFITEGTSFRVLDGTIPVQEECTITNVYAPQPWLYYSSFEQYRDLYAVPVQVTGISTVEGIDEVPIVLTGIYGNYGNICHSEGLNTYVDRGVEASHVEGLYTKTSSDGSHAEGIGTYTAAEYSHAEGVGTTTYGVASHAQGISTKCYGEGSFAAGIGTVSTEDAQTVVGRYNDISTALFVVGCGDHTEMPKNSLEVFDTVIKGPRFEITEVPQGDNDLVNVKYIKDNTKSIQTSYINSLWV